MVSINLDDLDHVTAVRRRARAAGNECSSEEEALHLLRFALVEHGIRLPPPKDWVLAIRERFNPLGIVDVIYRLLKTCWPMSSASVLLSTTGARRTAAASRRHRSSNPPIS